jgi:hypothetical protein
MVICTLTTALVTPAVFAAAPTLPADIGTWESYVRTCTSKSNVPLTITSYRKEIENQGSAKAIDVVDKEGRRIIQLEVVIADRLTFALIVKGKDGWITHNFIDDAAGMDKLDKELGGTLGMSMLEYYSCGKK